MRNKKKEVENNLMRIRQGLGKLIEAKMSVNDMQANLEIMGP